MLFRNAVIDFSCCFYCSIYKLIQQLLTQEREKKNENIKNKTNRMNSVFYFGDYFLMVPSYKKTIMDKVSSHFLYPTAKHGILDSGWHLM